MAVEAASHVNIFTNLEDNIKLVVQQIKDGETERQNTGAFSPDKYWEHLGVVFKALSLEGTKFSLAFTKPPFPSVKECEGMTVSMEKVVLELVSSYYSLPQSQGRGLHKSLRLAVLDVLGSVQGLVSSLARLDPCAGERKQATGIVWEEANTFSSLPKNNCEAVQRSLEQTSGMVEDALPEVEEILNNDGRCEDIFGDEEEGDGDNRDAWTAQDKETVAPVKGLIKTAVKLLQKATHASKAKGCCEREDQVSELDAMGDCAGRLSPAVDNLTSSLYAPVDHTALTNNAITLSDVITNMLNILRHSHMTEEADSRWLDFLEKANTHNLGTLTSVLKK